MRSIERHVALVQLEQLHFSAQQDARLVLQAQSLVTLGVENAVDVEQEHTKLIEDLAQIVL